MTGGITLLPSRIGSRVMLLTPAPKEVVMLDTQHWHVGVTYPGYQAGYEDQPFADVDGALDYADQTRDGFRKDGYKVTEVDRRDDDKAGVIERYRAADGKGATVAIVVVRPCYKGGCLLKRSYHSLPVEVAVSGDHWSRPRS
jgi:hypothetical protein